MIQDQGLLFATNELLPNNGGLLALGAFGGNSITAVAATPVAIDLLTTLPNGMRSVVDLAASNMEFVVDIVASSGLTDPRSLIEWRLVTWPVNPVVMAAGATTGRLATTAAQTITAASPATITLTGHGLALGTPFAFTAGTGGSGLTNDTIYYAIPTGADTFRAATSLANALAGTAVNHTAADKTGAILTFFPRILATTGQIPAAFCRAPTAGTSHRRSFVARTFPQALLGSGPQRLPYAAATESLPIGATGPDPSFPSPGRWLAMQVVVSGLAATADTLRYNASLVINGSRIDRHYPHANPIVG